MIQRAKKYTEKEIKALKPQDFLNLINEAKKELKNDPIMKKVFKKHKVGMEFIDLVPIRFGDIEVSATTSHGIITLNYKLLLDGDFDRDYGYLIHEIVHYLQQCFGKGPTQGADDGDYLENSYEKEGFQYQIEYIADNYGEDEADDYVSELLDHHKVRNKKERQEKKDSLMNKV